jgi:signal transduction histidine kinase
MVSKRFWLVAIMAFYSVLLFGKDERIATADSLIAAARLQYKSNFSKALHLASSAGRLSAQCGYVQGLIGATCISSVILSNTNHCHQALQPLRDLQLHYPAAVGAPVYTAMATVWFSHGNYDSACHYYTLAVSAYKDSAGQGSAYARACLALGRSYVKMGILERALEYYDKATKALKTEDDKGAYALSQDLLGEIYYAQRLYEKSLTHLANSLSAFRSLGDLDGEGMALVHSGNAYFMQIKDDSARECYTLALARFTTIGDSAGMAICYSNLSRIALEAKQTPLAIAYAQKALATIKPGNYINLEAGTYQQLGDIYAETKQYSLAVACLEKALAAARAADNKIIVKDCYKSISELLFDIGKAQPAFMYLLAAYRLRDTIEPISFARQLAEMDARYKAEKREAEIKQLKQQGVIDTLKVQQQHTRLQVQGYLLALLLVIIVASVAITYFRRSKRRLEEQIRKENLVRETEERERMRISKDIHDELGSGLSKILYLSERGQTAGAQGHITETARGLIGNMKDLVWAMNPENTTLSSLAARIREYSSEYLEDMPMVLDVDISHSLPEMPISKEATQSLFMIVKESLQNIVKYAKANKVLIRVSVDETFRLLIQDDGCGFDLQQEKQGNGLRNIRVRAQALGAEVSISTAPGKGTKIALALPLALMRLPSLKDSAVQ